MTAFIDIAVVPMDTDRVAAHQTVLVERGRITAMGPVSEIKVPAGAVRIDGQGKYLIPGLADLHAHIRFPPGSARIDSQGNLVMMSADDALTPEGRAHDEGELFLYVANGVTTIRDLSGVPTTLALRTRAARGELLSPRLYVGKHSLPTPSTNAAVAAVKAEGYDFIKIGSNVSDGGKDEQIAIFDSLVAAAARVGIKVAGHVPGAVGLPRVLQARMWSTEHLYGYAGMVDPTGKKSADQTDPAALRKMAAAVRQSGVWTCPTLVLGGSDSLMKRRLVGALQAEGAGLLLGTDAPLQDLVPGFSLHQELKLLVASGLTPYQALVTGTRNAAVFLGVLDSTGTVAVGKRADLVLLFGNPLADISATANPAGVMVGGRWITRAALDAGIDSVESALGDFKVKEARQAMRSPVVP